jgi:hydroxyacylglutathione hydrolase
MGPAGTGLERLRSAARAGLALVVSLVLAACAARVPVEPAAPGEARLVIDLRLPEAFAAGHAPGALNIQLGWDQLEGRTLSYVPDLDQPLAIRAADQDEAERAAAILTALGYRDLARFDPPEGLAAVETASLPWMSAADLAGELTGPAPPVVLDIRHPSEFEDGVIEGALLIHEDEGPASIQALDRGRRYAVVCEGGWRSSQLQSWMVTQGFGDVVNVLDGMAGWRDLD